VTRPRPRATWPYCPPWTPAARLWVVSVTLAVAAVLWWNIREFTTIAVLGILLAYILNPLILRASGSLRVGRGMAAILVYAILGVVIVTVPLISAPGVVGTVAHTDLPTAANRVVDDVFRALPQEVLVFGRRFDFTAQYAQVEEDLSRAADDLMGRRSLVWLLGFATDFAFTVLGVVVTFFVSLYIAMDAPGVVAWTEGLVPRPYLDVYRALLSDVDAVWRQFFRGQLILAAMVGSLTTIGLVVLGVPYALLLGLLAAVLEVVPRLGPVLATIPAAAVALVSQSLTFPELSGLGFALVVALLYVSIQQVENVVLVPRVLGGSVNLPPAVVLVAALAGAKLAGVAGIILAAPALGSLRVAGSWLHHQVTRTDGAIGAGTLAGAAPGPSHAPEAAAPETDS